MEEKPISKDAWKKGIICCLSSYAERIKQFSFEHSHAMDGIFLFIYSIEQALLVTLTYRYQAQIGIIISLFVITALFTFGMQKLFMDSKNAYLEKVVLGLDYDNEILTTDMANLVQQNSLLSKQLESLDEENRRLYKLSKPKGLNKNKANKRYKE